MFFGVNFGDAGSSAARRRLARGCRVANPPIPRHGPDVPVLALRLKHAAKAVGLGERTLWGLLAPRGPIPIVKVGAAVLVPVDGLMRWLAEEAAKSGAAAQREGGANE